MSDSPLVLERLRAQFPDAVLAVDNYRGDASATVLPERLPEIARFLRDQPDLHFDMPIDATAVDYLGQAGRFEVVYHLYSTRHFHRVRLKARLPESNPEIPTLTPVWVGMNWLERETYDLYGIRFRGHPDLRRIYLYEEFEGHPLRKDYPKEKRQPLIGPGANGKWSPQNEQRKVIELPAPDHKGMMGAELMRVQMGPSHPATHGTVRIILDLDGETIVKSDVQVGYLHRGFEKECESGFYYQAIPYTDRLNYSSAILCNVGYCMAVEKLLGIGMTPRTSYLRVLGGELARISDHLLGIGATCLELNAFTPFLYLLQARELVWDMIDALCGARVTSNYVRIGGMSSDLPEDFGEMVQAKLPRIRELIDQAEAMMVDNPIFRGRMEGTGMLSAAELIAFGVTGPLLRAAGVPLDLRRVSPYLAYGELDFDVPVGAQGDNMDRFLVKIAEMRQSARLVEQCLKQMPSGPVDIDDPRIRWPAKGRVFTRMEELIAQFKNVTEGVKPDAGEAYVATESANGEIGYFLVSDGTGKPYKCRARTPSFSNTQPLSRMIDGALLADLVPTFDMINMIGGECDR